MDELSEDGGEGRRGPTDAEQAVVTARWLRTEKLSRKRVENKIADDLFRGDAYHSDIRDGFARLA